MAITFTKESKVKYYFFTFLLIIFILVVLFFLWKYFLEEPLSEDVPLESYKKPDLKVDFDVLKNPTIESLKPFKDIEPTNEEVGRENPFLLYY